MKKERVILGITAFNHDASVCLIYNKKIIAFCEEERFNGEKHTGDFPIRSILFCLKQVNLSTDDITDVAFYFNPKKCFSGYFKKNNPICYILNPSLIKRGRFYYELVWLLGFINKINSIKKLLKNEKLKITYIEHHIAHAWYGYFASNFDTCTVLSNDSVGESVSSLALKVIRSDEKIKFEEIFSQNDPHSLGYLYGAVTEFLGFKRGSDEGKVMALAALGTDKYINYFNNAIAYLPNGEFRINEDLICTRNFQPKGQRLSDNFLSTYGSPKKLNESLSQKHYDIAYAVQEVMENVLKYQLNHIKDKNIVLTGGIAQNSVVNGKLSNIFTKKNIFVPPIPNDAGCSIGAALSLYYREYGSIPTFVDTAFLGPESNNKEITDILNNNKINFKTIKNPISFILEELLKEKTIALFRGKMECGPRALGYRSIIANPISVKMKDFLNNKVKQREFFQPYGGLVLDKHVKEVFDYKNENISGAYMSFVYPIKNEWLSKFPSLVHIDKTARIQIIKEGQDSFLEELLEKFYERTGVPLLINTSLNLKGQPMARSPQDCINTFYNSAIDYILYNNSILVSK